MTANSSLTTDTYISPVIGPPPQRRQHLGSPPMSPIKIQRLTPSDLHLIGELDRSEHVTHAYRIEKGEYRRRDVDWDIPTWLPGEGPHHVATHIADLEPILDAGGVLLGATDGEAVAGIAVVVPRFEEQMAWLAFLHVSRPWRRCGVGRALWDEASRLAREVESTSMYVSAIPSGPAVDFYRGRGCRPAAEPHPDLLAEEPDDLHLLFPL